MVSNRNGIPVVNDSGKARFATEVSDISGYLTFSSISDIAKYVILLSHHVNCRLKKVVASLTSFIMTEAGTKLILQ
jgi:hypothetical protein